MNITALQQAVRVLTGAAKDVNLRADAEAAPAVAPVARAGDAAQAPQATITGGGPAAQAMNAQVAARGSMLATVVAALGGNRYLLSVEGEDTPVVLSAAAIQSGGEFAPGTVVRLVPSEQPPAATAPIPARVDAQVSAAGRLLAQTGANPITDPRSPLAPANIGAAAAPLVNRPDAPETLARFLSQAVTESGLFYESHLADWVTGQRALSALAGEPQVAWESASDHGAPAAAGEQAPATGRPDGADTRQPGTATASSGTAHSAGSEALSSLAPAARALVREQLQALSSQWVAWRGEVWPGQQATVELGRDPIVPAAETTQPWRAHLAVTLPTLGRVDIALTMTGTRLDVRVNGDSPAHANRLAASRVPLLERLQSHGMMPSVRFGTTQDKSNDSA